MGSGAPVWITRAQPGAAATAERVAALGFTPIIDPLLSVEPIVAPIDLSGVAALAFTSVNGVEGFARCSARRDLPVFTVGAATAKAAQDAGFLLTRSADGDVEALEQLIADARPGAVLWAGAQAPAGDLVSGLRARGLEARGVSVYATVERAPSAATLSLFDAPLTVLVHSPRAARALADVVTGRACAHLRLLCLSAAVAAPLAKLAEPRSVAFAPRPDESALLQLLDG
ncbi:uroporphyrinogen-III synthase [Caulobacter vibrioides]|uniref:Uroporphyrinogen-III synthase n=1 Tax=Caulobacter vibrioides TaxID=155892 RepID=A0A290MX29_CAUVI|nr:uroporphyrinogen-III synthase [Caulobacter vibrioides]ATC33538.1 uroporphyrinogen-III synthase [Caulobacter vibrioides]